MPDPAHVETVRRGLAVWDTMQRDPMLLDGLTMGAYMDLIECLAQLLQDTPNLLRATPVNLINRLASNQDAFSQMETLREFLRLPATKELLDTLADSAREGSQDE
ncbi:MAG TPA: hypothetical protein VGA66_10325 [Mycobacterium sp.]